LNVIDIYSLINFR